MSMTAKNRAPLTIGLDPGQRELLDKLADDRGWSVGQCVRRIIAEHFARLQQQEEGTTP